MLLDYAHPQTPVLRTGLTIIAAIAVVAFGTVSAWCVCHAVHMIYEFQHNPGPFVCAEGAQAWVASLGLPLEQTIPIGVLSGGFTMVAFVQTVRHVNALRAGGHRRAA